MTRMRRRRPYRSARDIAGRVSEIDVHDNEMVRSGATLFKLDDAPFRIAVNDAAAHLAETRLQIESLKSTYRQRQAELRAAKDTQSYAQQQYERQIRLLASGISSQAQFDQASHALDEAKQEVANVDQQIGVALANSTAIRTLRRSAIRWSRRHKRRSIVRSSTFPIP